MICTEFPQKKKPTPGIKKNINFPKVFHTKIIDVDYTIIFNRHLGIFQHVSIGIYLCITTKKVEKDLS